MSQGNSLLGFFGGGGKAAKFPEVGTTVAGTITAVHPPEPQRDFETGLEKPGKTQVRIELATELRDPEIEFDDGARTLYVRGWLTGAIGDALRREGVKEPEVGGRLTVARIEDGPVTRPGLKPPYRYTATYAKQTASTGRFFSAQPDVPIPDTPPTGIDPAAWAAMSAEARQAIANSLAAGAVVANEPNF